MGECWQQKHTQHTPSMKMECDFLYGWNKKKTVTYAKVLPKMVNTRRISGNAEEEATVTALCFKMFSILNDQQITPHPPPPPKFPVLWSPPPSSFPSLIHRKQSLRGEEVKINVEERKSFLDLYLMVLGLVRSKVVHETAEVEKQMARNRESSESLTCIENDLMLNKVGFLSCIVGLFSFDIFVQCLYFNCSLLSQFVCL